MTDHGTSENGAEQFVKLAPFARRAGIAVTGRARLQQLQKHLEFVLITEDISPKSEQDLKQRFGCPVLKRFTSSDIQDLLGYRGTKVVGFKRSSLARSLYQACKHGAARESEP